MGDKAKEALGKVTGFFKKLSKKAIIAIIAGVAVLVVAATVITIVLNNQPYSVLFTQLNSTEAAAITSYLEEQGMTDYRMEGSSTILVPKNQEDQLKMQLLMQGYPKSGFSYDGYYQNVSSLSTESERNAAYLMMIQDRMGAVIRCFEGVTEAVVQINEGEDRTYILDSKNLTGATASVFVNMREGENLSAQQATAIRTFVSRGVQGLDISSVSIIDNWGNTYNAADGSDATDLSALRLQLEEENNNKIRTEILQVLVPLYGKDNVKVGVNCTVDVNRTIEESTTYNLPETAKEEERGLLNKKVYDNSIVRGDDETVGGVVGAQDNADLNTYVEEEAQANGDERSIHTSGEEDYDNDRRVMQIEHTAGYITDCMVSVTVNSTTAGVINVDALRAHVARVAGIDDNLAASKISILPGGFYQDPVINDNPSVIPPLFNLKDIPLWVLIAAAGGLLFFIILITLMVIISKKKRKKRELALAEAAAAAGAPGGGVVIPVEFVPQEEEEGGADVMSLQTEKSMELRRDIRQFAEDNPEIAAMMIRNLLKGGEKNG